MSDQTMLEAALFYHADGLCVIPVAAGEKRPALATWEEYQRRCSTQAEVEGWFGNGVGYNVGTVHGDVSGNYVLVDIDHDAGIYKLLCNQFPELAESRTTQSGSLEGYHIHVRVEELPDLGHDSRRDRPKGNRTWKTNRGSVNLRCRWCQSVQPPSVHPSGNLYRFIREGEIAEIASLVPVMAWLDTLAPPPAERTVKRRSTGGTVTVGGSLIEAVKAAWPTAITVFDHFGLVTRTQQEPDGETRLLGNGGLLVAEDDETWYNFSDEEGGGVLEAWAWCRYGSVAGKKNHFRAMLLEMAQAAGIDTAAHYKRGDERVVIEATGDRGYWTRQSKHWGQMR